MITMNFSRKIIADNRITIPPEIMKLLNLEIGNLVHVTIQKAEVKT